MGIRKKCGMIEYVEADISERHKTGKLLNNLYEVGDIRKRRKWPVRRRRQKKIIYQLREEKSKKYIK